MTRSWPVAMVVLLSACGGSPYAGFKQAEDGVYLRYNMLGDGEVVPADSDSVLLRVRVARYGDEPGSFMSTERWYRAGDLRIGVMAPVMRRIHSGDSLSLIAAQGEWPWSALASGIVNPASETDTLQAEVSLLDVRTPAMIRAAMADLQRSDPARFEQQVIARWIAEQGVGMSRWGTSDLHYSIVGTPKDTARAHLGDRVMVSWTGRRLAEGTAFDERESFSWRFGDSDQVIKGIEVAVSLLREGQSGSFVIPSMLAFGPRGIPGTLDPSCPVLYQVALIRVERTAPNN